MALIRIKHRTPADLGIYPEALAKHLQTVAIEQLKFADSI